MVIEGGPKSVCVHIIRVRLHGEASVSVVPLVILHVRDMPRKIVSSVREDVPRPQRGPLSQVLEVAS
jgi:hypothetical protein